MASKIENLETEEDFIVEIDLTTDDESTGQRTRRRVVTDKLQHMDLNADKIVINNKCESVFELRKLVHQHHPVSAFDSKHALEKVLSTRTTPIHEEVVIERSSQHENPDSPTPSAATQYRSGNDSSQPRNGNSSSEPVNGNGSFIPSAELHHEPAGVENAFPSSPERVQQMWPPSEPQPQSLIPNEIRVEMQALRERHIVHEVLQGPVQQEIEHALQQAIEHRQGRRRPRVRPRPQPHFADDGNDGGDEMGQRYAPPMGRLMSSNRPNRRGRASGSFRSRHAHIRPQPPTPNADGHYPLQRRTDQAVIVEQLRQSPALNSLGDETRDEIVAEVSSLVSRQLVTSALSGEFRGVLELHVQSRAEQINQGTDDGPLGLPHRYHDRNYNTNDHGDSLPSAGIQDLREEMMAMKAQLNELKQMVKLSFELQLDIQRSIRQEVAATLVSAQPHRKFVEGAEGSCTSSSPAMSALMKGGQGGTTPVDSGHCVICSEGVIDSVVYHCGHMCTCTACGLELKSKGLKCPICRGPITDVIRAYTSML